MKKVWVDRYAVLWAFLTLFLVVAGGLVTSHDGGLSVPDWPLSYGKLMPTMEGNIFYEHGHRMVATTVGLLTIFMAVWLWRAEDRRWMRNLGWIALVAGFRQEGVGGPPLGLFVPTPVML